MYVRAAKKWNPWPYVFTFPLVVFIVGLVFYPAVVTFVDSILNIDVYDNTTKFAGISNYVSSLRDPSVDHSLVNTFLYVLIGVVVSTVLAIVFALALWRGFKGRGIFLAILILPWALPGVVEGIIWNWIFDANSGVLNSFLSSLHLIHHYHLWLSGNRFLTIFFIELVQIWQITPLSTILVLASLQSIPKELYDAATVDGSGQWRTLLAITLPLIKPGITIAIIESLVMTFNVFDQPFVLNGNATTGSSIMLQTYNIVFSSLDFGKGYALSFLAAIFVTALSVGVLKLIYRRVEY